MTRIYLHVNQQQMRMMFRWQMPSRSKQAGRNWSRKKKSRPKAALQFKPDDHRSSGHQCWLRFPTIGHEANACEAEQQHRPCGGFGDSGCNTIVV
jgi:hypothetical protein